jgi:hypothetical protein
MRWDRSRLIAAGQTAAEQTSPGKVADVLTWRPKRRYRLWHDRAVFHFLTDLPTVRLTATWPPPRLHRAVS